MPDIEKKTLEVPHEITPDSSSIPSKAETVESKPLATESVLPVEVDHHEPISEPVFPTFLPPKPIAQVQKDPLEEEIEEILSEDLEEIYKKLPPERQQKFKEEGEKTAGVIKQMIQHGKIHGRKLVHLIVHWLKLIPGVNKFFLEQESKIKADLLIEVAEEQKQKK